MQHIHLAQHSIPMQLLHKIYAMFSSLKLSIITGYHLSLLSFFRILLDYCNFKKVFESSNKQSFKIFHSLQYI
jgi:hypothetical protein